MQLSVEEAGPRLDELIGRMLAGEEVIITRDGRPVARLVPVLDPDRRDGQDDQGDFNGPL